VVLMLKKCRALDIYLVPQVVLLGCLEECQNNDRGLSLRTWAKPVLVDGS